MRLLLNQLRALLDRPTKVRLGLATLVSALGNPPADRLMIYVTAMVVGLFVAKDVGALGFMWWMARFKGLNRVRTSTQLLRHFLTSPYTEISRRSTSELIRTMVDAVAQVYGSVVYGLMQIIINGLAMLAILAVLLYTAPLPTIALVTYLGLASVVYLRVMKPKAMRAGQNSAAAAQAAWRSALAALGGLKETRVRGSEAHFVGQFETAAHRGVRPAQIAEFIAGAPKYLLEILFIIAVGVILVVGTVSSPGLAGTGSVVGLLAMFVAAGFRSLPAASALLGNINGIRFGVPFLDLVHAEVERIAQPVDLPSGPRRRLDFAREVSVDNISFRYPGAAQPTLKQISFTLPYGGSLALVGGSGAGKTTLVDTFLGLHHPSSGRITADGRDVAEDIPGWQANIGYVPQDVFLLDATLAENIAFDEAPDQIDPARLAAVVDRAQLGDFVDGLPDGLDTQIGERGSRLSGGQRQRVGIARALYREPRLLVLDEATSSLDNETEHRISAAITALRGEVTVVIVAHRLSTVRHVDTIAFMEDGQVVAAGTFEEVRRANESFDRLVRLGSLA